mmetsp:Transcript_72678/g.173214  ORF Transcript_72678/g.173214 Transcript_72678/m.173214 type:complete len:200 (+) Transcript_72678:2072-2671(+)
MALMVMVVCEKSNRFKMLARCCFSGEDAGLLTTPCDSNCQPVALNMLTSTALPTTPSALPLKGESECVQAIAQRMSIFQSCMRISASNSTGPLVGEALLVKGPSDADAAGGGMLRQWTPKNLRLLSVSVPVLSKHATRTLPARAMRFGATEKTPQALRRLEAASWPTESTMWSMVGRTQEQVKTAMAHSDVNGKFWSHA